MVNIKNEENTNEYISPSAEIVVLGGEDIIATSAWNIKELSLSDSSKW